MSFVSCNFLRIKRILSAVCWVYPQQLNDCMCTVPTVFANFKTWLSWQYVVVLKRCDPVLNARTTRDVYGDAYNTWRLPPVDSCCRCCCCRFDKFSKRPEDTIPRRELLTRVGRVFFYYSPLPTFLPRASVVTLVCTHLVLFFWLTTGIIMA